jgi:glycosyltransferase involved in cell wall biosynthesis
MEDAVQPKTWRGRQRQRLSPWTGGSRASLVRAERAMAGARTACEIGVNARCLAKRLTGIERYAGEVTSRIADRVTLITPRRWTHGLAGHAWEQVWLPRHVASGGVLWSPANTGPLTVANQVVTIHDLSALEHPEWFTARFTAWYRYLLPRLARAARRVITDSEFSRSRIVERLGVREDRVVTIPLGVSDHFAPQPPARVAATRGAHGLARPYLLVVGSLQPRKNLARLLRVWQRLERPLAGLALAVVGDRDADFAPIALDAPPASVRFLGPVDDADLPALYAGALGCVVPSMYEGFGLPLLEAMACGVPCAASANTALREVAGGVAVPLDPYDEDSMETAIRTLVEDDSLRDRLRTEGLARAAAFTWDRTAEQTWAVLASAGRES